MFASVADYQAFIEQFAAGQLPRAKWTHEAHLAVGLWHLAQHAPDTALALVRERIKAHNVAVGTPNTDASGYHETITRFYLLAIEAHRQRQPGRAPLEALEALLASPLADSRWPLQHYSGERLFSVAARRGWLEPDLKPL
ncbi:MAG TPA: hypothetical protein VMI92_06725 [Steroidobacteraceae bacterium]|nr:hypothetical protein [Steroidobacteraceae bacterium]